MALQLNYTDKSGRLNENAYLNIGFGSHRKFPRAIQIYIYASAQAYQDGKLPIDGVQEFAIDEADAQEFFSLEKQQIEGSDMIKLGYEFLKSDERLSIIPIDFSEAQNV